MMRMRRRVILAYLTCWAAILAAFLLVYQSPVSGGWQLFAWSSFSLIAFVALDRVTRCPFCRERLIRDGIKPDLDRFAYIRCQGCRRRFDGGGGPDPEISDEALAAGDPTLLAAYRETSAHTRLSLQALREPQARRVRLTQLEKEVREWEDELRRVEAAYAVASDADVVDFVRGSLAEARREIAELRRLDAHTGPAGRRGA